MNAQSDPFVEQACKKAKTQPLHSDKITDNTTASNFRHIKVQHFHLEIKVDFEKKELAVKELIDMKCLQKCDTDNCPDNWPPRSAGQSSCYIYFHQGREWDDAERECRNWGGRLVKFDTEAEITTVRNFLTSYYGIKSNTLPWMWTGLNDRASEGRYRWTGFGGELSRSSSMWNGGQPDNHRPWYAWWDDEDCVEFNGSKLNDQDCDEDRPYVCEYHP